MTHLETGASDVCGVAGETLTPELTFEFAQAFTMYLKGAPVLVFRDTRRGCPMVVSAVVGAHPAENGNLLGGAKAMHAGDQHGRSARWFLVRGSKTEPALRPPVLPLVAEAQNGEEGRKTLKPLRISVWLSETSGGHAPSAAGGAGYASDTPPAARS
ncbi:MAG: hypothetical protein ACE148_00160 [Vicinamibacterales bacterium]